MVDTKYDEQTGEPLWKEQGADTWHPFNNATLLWTNPSPNSSFAGGLVAIDLSQYHNIVIIGKYADTDDVKPRCVSLIIKNVNTGESGFMATGRSTRTATATDSGVTFGAKGTLPNGADSARYCIPLYILGMNGNMFDDYIS